MKKRENRYLLVIKSSQLVRLITTPNVNLPKTKYHKFSVLCKICLAVWFQIDFLGKMMLACVTS